MSDMTDKERERQTRTERELEKMGEGSTTRKPKPKPKPKPAPKEKAGVGRDHSQSNAERLGAKLRSDIAAAEKSGNKAYAEKLRARLKALMETVQ